MFSGGPVEYQSYNSSMSIRTTTTYVVVRFKILINIYIDRERWESNGLGLADVLAQPLNFGNRAT